MKKHGLKIVADGPQRNRDGRDYAAVRKRVLAKVAQRYESQKKGALVWVRLWLEINVLREANRELKKEFPDGGLYFAVSPR